MSRWRTTADLLGGVEAGVEADGGDEEGPLLKRLTRRLHHAREVAGRDTVREHARVRSNRQVGSDGTTQLGSIVARFLDIERAALATD